MSVPCVKLQINRTYININDDIEIMATDVCAIVNTTKKGHEFLVRTFSAFVFRKNLHRFCGTLFKS